MNLCTGSINKMESAMNLKLALRASYVMRWTIVEMGGRGQSVAEHQWRVWLIATALWDSLFDHPISLDRHALMEHALTHDLGECLTGDIPTPGKKLIGTEACKVAELNAIREVSEELYNLTYGVKGTLVECVVKIADLMESITYLERWGQNRNEVLRIFMLLQQDLREWLTTLSVNTLSGKWLVHGLTKFDQAFHETMGYTMAQAILNVEAKS